MDWAVLASFEITTCLVGLLLLVMTIYMFTDGQVKNLPPSPGVAFPFIGHVYLLKRNPRNQFKQWADRFGDAFRLQMGSQTVIVFNTFEAIKAALVKQADYFSDRPTRNFLARHMPYLDKGIVFSSGANWKEQRTTSLSILRTFGMGKNILADKISEEVSVFVTELSNKNGNPSDIKSLTNISVSNVICSIIFGKRFEFDDPNFNRMIGLFNTLIRLSGRVAILNVIPLLYYLPFDIFKGRQLITTIKEVRKFVREMVEDIKREYDPDDLNNFIVAYMDEMQRKEESGEETYLDDVNLVRNIDNLFIAGTETTSTTIQWSLLYVLNNPETQKKIYKEILEHVGTERMPNMADKPKLKYLTAFIMEVQRMASIVPFSMPHVCNHETTVAGYTIPKGAQIFPNLDAVLKSEKIWVDPNTFRPERFLDSQGNVVSREELIPFSIGRRICLGEALAKMELFLYLSSLFQRFEFLPADPENIPPLKDVFGTVASAAPYAIRCVDRNL